MKIAVKPATVCMFYTNWCPHSRRIMPLWQSLQFQYEGKIINNYKLRFVEYNFTDPRWKPEFPSEMWNPPSSIVDIWMKQYNVMGFPTVRIHCDNREIEYDSHSPLTAVTLKQFIRKSLHVQ